MKKVLNFLVDFLGSIGKARAATTFTRMGRYDLAKEVMMRND